MPSTPEICKELNDKQMAALSDAEYEEYKAKKAAILRRHRLKRKAEGVPNWRACKISKMDNEELAED